MLDKASVKSNRIEIKIQCGKFWVSPNELPKKEPLRSIMVDILNCQPNDCRTKKNYLELVEFTATELIKTNCFF